VGGEIHGLLNQCLGWQPSIRGAIVLEVMLSSLEESIKSYLNMCAPFKGCCNIANVMNKYDNYHSKNKIFLE
jgi:hypothetical protein